MVAAPLALKTVQEFLETHPDTALERVVFAMFQAAEYEAFQAAWDAVKGSATDE